MNMLLLAQDAAQTAAQTGFPWGEALAAVLALVACLLRWKQSKYAKLAQALVDGQAKGTKRFSGTELGRVLGATLDDDVAQAAADAGVSKHLEAAKKKAAG